MWLCICIPISFSNASCVKVSRCLCVGQKKRYLIISSKGGTLWSSIKYRTTRPPNSEACQTQIQKTWKYFFFSLYPVYSLNFVITKFWKKALLLETSSPVVLSVFHLVLSSPHPSESAFTELNKIKLWWLNITFWFCQKRKIFYIFLLLVFLPFDFLHFQILRFYSPPPCNYVQALFLKKFHQYLRMDGQTSDSIEM